MNRKTRQVPPVHLARSWRPQQEPFQHSRGQDGSGVRRCGGQDECGHGGHGGRREVWLGGKRRRRKAPADSRTRGRRCWGGAHGAGKGVPALQKRGPLPGPQGRTQPWAPCSLGPKRGGCPKTRQRTPHSWQLPRGAAALAGHPSLAQPDQALPHGGTPADGGGGRGALTTQASSSETTVAGLGPARFEGSLLHRQPGAPPGRPPGTRDKQTHANVF